MKHFLLLGILILTFLLRVVLIDKFPVGFTPDEASFGYDAYSILKTGRDQWGHFLPLTLESFGDYKSPLYAYLTIPFVAVLGLTKTAVRLPNAILGSMAVLVTYFLVREIQSFQNPPSRSPYGHLEGVAKRLLPGELGLVAAFLLAISPWHVSLSRGAFEANLTTFFLPLGILLFLRGLQATSYLLPATIVFGLNLFTYHSAKLVTPAMVCFLAFLFRNDLKKISLSKILPSVVAFTIFIIIMVYSLVSGGLTRAGDLSIFRGSLEASAKERIELINAGVNPVWARITHNKYQYTMSRFVNNYSQYFSYKFLFKTGPREATYGMLPGRGVLYLIELPFIVGFLLYFVGNRKEKPLWLLVFWLFTSPIPAALSTGVGFAANRTAIMLPAWQIILALGALELIRRININAPRAAKAICVILPLIYIISITGFAGEYFQSISIPKSMLYGNLEATEYLKDFKMLSVTESPKILMGKSLSEPQIYVAFANRWDPGDFQKQTKTWNYREQGVNWVDQMEEYSLGNYTFKTLKWESDRFDYNYLVGKPVEFPKDLKPIFEITYPDQTPALYVVKGETVAYAKN